MKKGQAALEFLVTYGWAILIVLVMIGALTYFGVTNPTKYLPEKCVFGSEFTCEDFYLSQWTQEGFDASVGDSEVTFVIKNNLGEAVTLTRPNITYDGVIGNAACGIYGYYTGGSATTYTLAPGESVAVTCNPGNSKSFIFSGVGQHEKVTVKLTYRKAGKTFQHVTFGEISGEVVQQTDRLP